MSLGESSLIDIDHVVGMNRRFGESLGWNEYRGHILRLLGIGAGADEKAFAESVAAWQRRNKVPRTGIINHETWFRMQVALGLLDPPFPSGPFDENHITNVLFNSRHPERNLAPIKGEAKLIEEWKNIRNQLVRPALKQAPLCEASGPDFDRLADYLRWFNGELRKKTPDSSRLARLKTLLLLQVKLILKSLDRYIKSGCEEPNLETLRLFVRALLWPKEAQDQRTILINGIHEAQKNALTASDKRTKQCKGSGIVRLEVRKPKDFAKSFTKDVTQALLAGAAIQIFVPKNTTEVSQLEWLHATLEWICPQAKTARGRSGGERGVHKIVWTVTEKEGGACPLNIVGNERLACDGHTYGLAVKPGSTLRESAEKKGFDLDKCEWEFVETFRATTSAYNGLNPLGRCIWGFQFTAKQNIDKSGRIIRSAAVKYWGVDKELEVN
ncbi:MAG TPA: hypothetical protein VF088_22200 [Pyrinomonadaceae bacterium]